MLSRMYRRYRSSRSVNGYGTSRYRRCSLGSVIDDDVSVAPKSLLKIHCECGHIEWAAPGFQVDNQVDVAVDARISAQCGAKRTQVLAAVQGDEPFDGITPLLEGVESRARKYLGSAHVLGASTDLHGSAVNQQPAAHVRAIKDGFSHQLMYTKARYVGENFRLPSTNP